MFCGPPIRPDIPARHLSRRDIATPCLSGQGPTGSIDELPAVQPERLGNGRKLIFGAANALEIGLRGVTTHNIDRRTVTRNANGSQRRCHAAMASDFMTEIRSVGSVSTMTPAFPSAFTMTSAATTFATARGSVEMLVKRGVSANSRRSMISASSATWWPGSRMRPSSWRGMLDRSMGAGALKW